MVVAVGLALFIRTFLVQPFYIPSGSMENTLQVNDRILVNKLSYRFGDIERGHVVVFDGTDSWEPEVRVPEPANALEGAFRWVGELLGLGPTAETIFIKRVIGLPGDTVKCCDAEGRVTVNGIPLNEQDYLFPGNKPSELDFQVEVPPGRLWVMGDHRGASADSRAHLGSPGGGTISVDHVHGRAFVILWPLPNWALLDRPSAFTTSGL